jgi:hypothetical protein
MWNYKITKTELGWIIYRKYEKGWLISIRFLSWDNKWVINKWSARVFYNKEDALSALTIKKIQDGKESD